MPFIGLISKESDGNFIKNEVYKNSVKNRFEFININKKNIENLKNIRFETILIDEEQKDFFENSKYLENIIKKSKFLVINSDIVKNKFKNNKLITYGLNQSATITISSIKSENILICVQKKFEDIHEKMVEEQEKRVEIGKSNLKKVCNSLAVFTILTIYGENLKKI